MVASVEWKSLHVHAENMGRKNISTFHVTATYFWLACCCVTSDLQAIRFPCVSTFIQVWINKNDYNQVSCLEMKVYTTKNKL